MPYCQKYRSKPADRITALQPTDRVNASTPFFDKWIIFCWQRGFYLKKLDEIQKSHIVLFTCEITKALHLEIVTDMTTVSSSLHFEDA